MSTYLAQAHNDWHIENGWKSGCPLDCAASDPEFYQCSWCGDYNEPGTSCLKPSCVAAFAAQERARAVKQASDSCDLPF